MSRPLEAFVTTLVTRTMKSGPEVFPGTIAVSDVLQVKPGVHIARVDATYGGVTVSYRARIAAGRVTLTRADQKKGGVR